MLLDTSRFLSDRVVFDDSIDCKLRVTNSFWDWCLRIISWIFSPSCYSDENIRTIQCFKKYLVDTLGSERFFRVTSRYSLDFDEKMRTRSPLLLRDVAKIVIGAQNVSVKDVNELIHKKRALRDPDFVEINSFEDLDSAKLALLVFELSRPFGGQFQIADIAGKISGKPTEFLARCFYDPFLADREKLQLVQEHPQDHFETFVHNMVARVIKREMRVGTIVPAPNHQQGRAQFYYVSAKVITGKGMVSYLLHPVTNDTDLPPIRFFRGTAPRNGEIDALSTVITDVERDLGRMAYQSGMVYEPTIQQKLTVPVVEAGHSLGATVVQWRLANMDHIRKAYLYCGPGLPMREVRKFNRKNLNVDLVVRITSTDSFRKLGDAHLGYHAPRNVRVDLVKYYPLSSGYRGNPHVTVWGRGGHNHGVEGGITLERRDALLFHKTRSRERIRSVVGPCFAAILEIFKLWFRPRFLNRTEEGRGLKIGSMQGGLWHVDHFREISYNRA